MDFVQKTDDECVRNIFCFSSRLMNCESMEYVLGDDGKVYDDGGFDQNEVAQMNWYAIDELEEEEEVEILSK